MATTLYLSDVQRAKAEKGDTMGMQVVSMLRDRLDIADKIPWKTTGTVEVRNSRTAAVPLVGFRQGRGASFGTISGVTRDQVSDAVYSLGARIEIDKTDLRDKEAPDILKERTRLAVEAMSWKFMDHFINGDHATEPHGFEGVKVRLANMAAGQTIYGDSNAAELDIRASASPSDATLYTFLDRIDAAVDELDGHDADIALTQSDFLAAFRSVLRRLGKYNEGDDPSPKAVGTNARRTSNTKSGKPVLTYKGISWYDMGYKADQVTPVIGTDTVNSAACRPVYFLKLGHPFLYGIQQYPLEVDPPKVMDDGVTTYVNVDWPLGLAHVHVKSITKLAGVRVA